MIFPLIGLPIGTIFAATVSAVFAFDGQTAGKACAHEAVVKPKEYPRALRNPLKGFRSFRTGETFPYGTMKQTCIRWLDLENDESDGIEKIRRHCDKIWKNYPQRNLKAIPRVYLHWSGGQFSHLKSPRDEAYWPTDMTPNDYSSGQFKKRLTRLIKRLGQCWDNDPRVAYIEMGLIGWWGEMHHPHPWPELQKLLGDAFTAAFKNKLILAGVDSSWGIIRWAGHPSCPKFSDYPKLGFYWDNFVEPSEEEQAQYIEDLGDQWHWAVMGGELCWGLPNWQKVINYIRRLHTNHLSWGAKYQDPVNRREWADKIQKTFGYRFIIDEVRYPAMVMPNKPFKVLFILHNTGSSPFYYNWPVGLSLLDVTTKEVVWKDTFKDIDIRKWLPGDKWDPKKQQYAIRPKAYTAESEFTVPAGIQQGRYILALAILDPAGMLPSARFAIENYFTGGRHPIGYIGLGQAIRNPELMDVVYDDPQADWTLHYVYEPHK